MTDQSQYKKGSVVEFDDNWKIRSHEARQNYYTSGRPTNQIMMSFKNQWKVYSSFIKNPQPGMKVLEPGSGRGSISCYFAAHGFDCYLLDTSAEILAVAKDIFKENNLPAHYVCEDALHMSFSDNYFDVIVHCGLLEHFEDYRQALIEQYRVLKPGGIIISNIVPGKWSVQKAFGFINLFLKFVHGLLTKLKLVNKAEKAPKKPLYRSDHGSEIYIEVLRSLGAAIEYQGGIFPVPSLSYSPAFPFTVMSPKIEKFLVWLWYLVLAIRKMIWPKRHPWMCSEKWGQHVLVVARKPINQKLL
ncbi:MAG: hypothetical protein A2744_02355 [Candidatus Buchananbacteria bacterium RIFCSPHIGHO2_01_FULL_44_11]|uniref:Methyltransferase type 11 domain-containing protein n=1 Tax=Candidatus Buchananbacteria bacterium RIFCSPHIGHO2_01_FULL_44_11 TaxID=1797535 RepID=A0A1G1XZP6_9BACT|nr:MAG: hypothetical protein A2744_02355 [Candidatus Buchananbacteria bacterium RIFCSPHIGHO2_01_FULL_44_11]